MWRRAWKRRWSGIGQTCDGALTDRLSWGNGTPIMSREENLELFFKEERTVILPIDHGVAIPVPGLEKPAELIERINPFVDGYVMNLGLAIRVVDLTAEKGVCLLRLP
jgi:DhnA family fructose-bisphosphate aldolase class Ia